jgi:hypothetical protein
MKKFLVPSLLVLLVAGLGQRESTAGSFSIGISIGDSHRHSRPPVVVAQPPVVYAPPVVCAPPVVVARPPVVYAPAYSPYYVRECERRDYRHGHGHYRGDYHHRHDGYRR